MRLLLELAGENFSPAICYGLPHEFATCGGGGGGAAGFFAAITCAQAAPDIEVTLLEKGPQFLSKVRISGGGRCNVTHACFQARELAAHYPRGEQALIAPFHSFQASNTVAWFEARGVKLKTEKDGRMFPTTDSSQTVIDCLLGEAKAAGVKLMLNRGIESADEAPGRPVRAEAVRRGSARVRSSAPGDGRMPRAGFGTLAVSLGHTLEPPVPSLFTFHIETPWVQELAGVSVEAAEVSVPGTDLRERGPLLLTHWGLSGPAILRLSAWGARELHGFNYQFPLLLNWLPHLEPEALAAELQSRRNDPARALGSEHADCSAEARLGNGWHGRRAFRATGAGPRFPGPGATSLSNNCTAPNCK